MAEFVNADLREAGFTGSDLSGARFRNVDLTGVKMVDAVLVNADLSGMIDGLVVNGIEVAPLIAAELERRHPERRRLLAVDPDGLRVAWAMVETFWNETVERARRLPEEMLHDRVDDEWSFVETLRHLVFVTDAWIGRVVLGRDRPYHPLGLPPSFVPVTGPLDVLNVAAEPTLDAVLEARQDRMRMVQRLVDGITAEELALTCEVQSTPGYPTQTEHTVLACLHIVIDEEWAHHGFARRDLAQLERTAAAGDGD